MHVDVATIDRALRNAQERLFAERASHGGWQGELASSALATATAVFALATADEQLGDRHGRQIRDGITWLIRSQNRDGGWGDTPASVSNISTTALAWAALTALNRSACRVRVAGVEQSNPPAHGGLPALQPSHPRDNSHVAAREAAERWLQQTAGTLAPQGLAKAIADRYGKDRTFSVPILSMLAVAGCLGDERSAWSLVPQLPFELAACPHQWFKWLRLPVVSYALPALIALGYLRHQRRADKNPVSRLIRRQVTRRVLQTLQRIQPASGGFLEATPLTSFVVMSLATSGKASHPVVGQGIAFLTRSQRADGSWPIDTNLATWVTTLAVNALEPDAHSTDVLGQHECRRILTWLLDQQYQGEHPYTHAAPGGWAWTDLPGGVPDADDTSGALLALRRLAEPADDAARAAAARGVTWLLDLQNRDGGIPTFCRGWLRLAFDQSSPDITAHAVRAILSWRSSLDRKQRTRCDRALGRMLQYLANAQRSDGAWSPLWFGDQHAPAEENLTYGTSRVLRAAAAVPAWLESSRWRAAVARGHQWLVVAQNKDSGWGGAPDTPSVIETTALSLEALAALAQARPEASNDGWQQALRRGAAWLCDATNEGSHFSPSPIGLYFARLWYHEKLYPLIFSVSAFLHLKVVLHAELTPAEAGDGIALQHQLNP